MRILLLGKNGQVGWELQRSLAPLGDVLALDRYSAQFCGDLSKPEDLADTVRKCRPQVIVNAAAYTAVDMAESEPEMTRQINAAGPAALAQAAREIGAWVVQYSTDYVFDGSGTSYWREDDPTSPLNTYGQTKLEGEQAVAKACPQHLIFRTSWVYAARGDNFAKTILRLAQERQDLSVINDQIGAPTSAELIADVTAHAVRQVTMQSKAQSLAGIYHLVASGETSWHGYASHVLESARQMRPDLQWKAAEIVPVASSAFPRPARRPLNSRLNTEKFRTTFGLGLPHWKQGVNRFLAEVL